MTLLLALLIAERDRAVFGAAQVSLELGVQVVRRVQHCRCGCWPDLQLPRGCGDEPSVRCGLWGSNVRPSVDACLVPRATWEWATAGPDNKLTSVCVCLLLSRVLQL